METLNRKVDKQLNKLGLGESYLDESIQIEEKWIKKNQKLNHLLHLITLPIN